MRRNIFLVVAIVLGVFGTSSPSPAQTQPSTGAKIGTIIKDAIEIALPNTTKLIETIFGRTNRADKVSATAAIDAQAAAAKQAVNTKLTEIADIANELSVVGQYLEVSVPAAQKIARIVTRLDSASGNTMPPGVKADLDDLDKLLAKFGDIKMSELNRVDSGLRLRLIEIRGVYEANKSDLRVAFGGNEIADLRTQLRAISSLLNSVVSIAGIEITNLQAGLETVTRSIGKTPMGGSTPERLKLFADAAEDDVTLAKRTIRKAPPAR